MMFEFLQRLLSQKDIRSSVDIANQMKEDSIDEYVTHIMDFVNITRRSRKIDMSNIVFAKQGYEFHIEELKTQIMRPVFNEVYIEGSYELCDGRVVPIGLFFKEYEDDIEGGFVVDVLAFTKSTLKTGETPMVDGEIQLFLDKKGYIKYNISGTMKISKLPGSSFARILTCCHKVQQYLMCKNIELVEKEISKKRTTRQLKNNGVSNKYYILTIKQNGKKYQDQQPSGIQKDLPLHVVRGHIKHYTKEKPHVSGLVGNIFCPSFARGSKDHGTITKDYRREK